MKRLTLVASIIVLAACATKEETTIDSSAAAAPAMTPAPAAMDSAAMDTTMKHDTTKM